MAAPLARCSTQPGCDEMSSHSLAASSDHCTFASRALPPCSGYPAPPKEFTAITAPFDDPGGLFKPQRLYKSVRK